MLASVKVLKLCTSDETAGDIPDSQRAYSVAERFIAAATGEPVQTTLRPIWPDDGLPDLIDRWLDRYEPDMVLFVVSPFWMTFESTPLKLQRKFGRLGTAVGGAGARVGGYSRISGTKPMQWLRRGAVAAIGGEYYFTPSYISELVERCGRRVLAREDVELVVRGPLEALGHHGTAATLRRAHARRNECERRLIEVCARLHAPYVTRAAPQSDDVNRANFGGDFVHTNVDAHRERGELEGRALAAAWSARQIEASRA